MHTYKRSHKYLERYRLLAMVDEFVKATETSLANYTIDWLIECIRQRHDVDNSERRILYDSEDSEIEIEIEWDDEGNRGKLRRPRRARHLSKAEARSVLAKDARWLLAEQLKRRANKRTLSVYALCRFCSEIARMKRWNGRRRPRVGNELSAMALFGFDINLNKYYRKGKTKAEWQKELKRAVKYEREKKSKAESLVSPQLKRDILFGLNCISLSQQSANLNRCFRKFYQYIITMTICRRLLRLQHPMQRTETCDIRSVAAYLHG